jgi:hypothetical protein
VYMNIKLTKLSINNNFCNKWGWDSIIGRWNGLEANHHRI